MKSRFGTLALASGSLLALALIGCNPPIDEKKSDTAPPTVTTEPRDKMAPPVTPGPEVKADPTAGTPAVTPAETPKTDAMPPAGDPPKPAADAPKS